MHTTVRTASTGRKAVTAAGIDEARTRIAK
jgi:hypothetical protein